ncbi:MAG: efflux RND transporter permease subunit [Kiloniellales bacterium]
MIRPGPTEKARGIIPLFARHPTAMNLLMAMMLIAGAVSLSRINTQFFPDFGIEVIAVTVEWPGASAEDVDANIVQSLEPELRFLDGVKLVRSSSAEGLASVVVEFHPGTDMQAALSDAESAIGQVTNLPEDSERPLVKRIVRYDSIQRIVVSGPYPEISLKAIAERMRDQLLARGIDKVDLFGARDEEIWVEVAPATLRRLDLTLAQVAERIASASKDLPSGDTRGDAERQIRSLGLLKDARALEGLEVRALESGQKILLGDIARVSERFDDSQPTARRLGQPAIELHVQRAVNNDALELAAIVDQYLDEVRASAPPNLRIESYNELADLIRGRIRILVNNGSTGLVLVLGVLFLFLNGRVAFWVAAGIPISLMATLAAMLFSGQTINMVSLFGMIMVLGIIVDDAIVVGEHAETRFRAGMAPLDAVITGARRMAPPVFASSLTTLAAFIPLYMIAGIIGQIIHAIPFVVVTVLLASLMECFLILPGHLRGALTRTRIATRGFRRRFDDGFARLRDGVFRRAVARCLEWRYTTVATTVAALIMAIGLVVGGRVGFYFFPTPEADWIYANVSFVAGTARGQTEAMLDRLERAALAAERELTGGAGGLVRFTMAKVGDRIATHPGVGDAARLESGDSGADNLGGLAVELETADEREVRANDFIAAWRAHIGPMAGLDTLAIVAARGGPPGRDIDVRMSGDDVAGLKAAGEEVRALLRRYPGVSEVETNLPYGKPETILAVTPRGRALGFDTESVGRQVRNAFQGAIAKRFPRGDEEVVVRVQYPRDAIDMAALDDLYLRAPGGAEVPLSEVVSRRDKLGFARIVREGGKREVAVTAELDKRLTSTNKVLAALERDGLHEIAARHDVRFRFAGKAEEQAETFGDMQWGAGIGLIAIYIVLAWVFASYSLPLVIMAIIPFGFLGAVSGHWLLGFDLTILSLIALIGLSGILVNDSIILVSTIGERRTAGEAPAAAIVSGACDRLRAVILTSATTIGGLTPLLFERSLQAQFLIPMAITIVFGLLVATVLVLVVVPALIGIHDDLARLGPALLGRRRRAGAGDEASLAAGD